MAYNLAPLQNLIDQFERMQGIGHKTAQRMAFYVLGLSDKEANDFAKAITDAHTKIRQCKICCDLADDELCPICKSNTRDKSVICVVEDPRDVAAIERTHEYNGTYHVLHGAISPMDNIGPDQIRIIELFALAKPDLELCSALFYIKLERNNRQSLLLTFAEKLHNFALMEQ